MRMGKGREVLDRGLGTGTGRCGCGRMSLTILHSLWMLAIIPTSQTGLLDCGVSGRAVSQPSASISTTDLVQPAALADE